MAIKKSTSSNNSIKILLASIPVLGSIIIAFVSTNNFKCNPQPVIISSDSIKEIRRISLLKTKAGEINDDIVYARYQDLFPTLAETLKPYITENVFNKERDSAKIDLGEFIKPIDTIYSKAYGTDYFFVKNQYQKGINLIAITFDQNEKVIGLVTRHLPN